MQKVVVVVGPTASGKSALAQELAKRIGGEVVSADSMQIYRGLDIGTGKVPESQREVPHWGFDLVEPSEPYSAALFQAYARKCFKGIEQRGNRAILCGGTGFYVRAAIDDYRFPEGEQVNNVVRDKYRAFAQEKGKEALWEELKRKDPESASLIAANDVKRVVRAFELLDVGTSYAVQKANLQDIAEVVPSTWVGLEVEPSALRERIDARVEQMIADGLVYEVQSLLDKGLRSAITANQAIGYKEIVAYLDGRQTLEEATELIKIATHRYAKRQRTWFRKESRIHWIDANDLNIDLMVERALPLVGANS